MAKPPAPQPISRIQWLEEDAHERFAHIVRDTSNAFQRLLQSRLTQHGIALGQWSILRALWSEEGLSQHELSERAGVMDPTGVVTIRTMEQAGLVVRLRKLEDRKRIFVYLTARGRALREVLEPIAEQTNDLARAGIPEEDLEVTRRTLLSMARNLAVANNEGNG